MSAAEDFAPYKLQCVDDMQHDDEVIRPIVLCAEPMAERRRQTGIERTSVGDKARRFVMEGMLGLVEHRVGPAGRKGHVSPEAVAASRLYVQQLSPPIHDRAVVRILQRKFGSHTTHHTVPRFCARHALPVPLELQRPVFATCAEAYQARWTVVRMWDEGWNKPSIAGCLQLSRTPVSTILEACARDGFAGLEEQRTRPPQHPGNPLTLPFLQEVLDIQREYPRAGRLRGHGLLETRREEAPPSEATVGRAMALNRPCHGAPGPWASAQEEAPSDTTPKHLPYRPRYRHHRWFIDMRSLVRLDGGWVYSLCMLEGYARTSRAGMASPHQDRTAVLQLLFAALAEYGCPAMVIADHGAVFRAHDYPEILRALESAPTSIELRKPWQNLIDAQLKVQLRLADFTCEPAQTFEEIQALHAACIETFKTTRHWAHQDREEGRRTPVEVWEWVRGRSVERARLPQLFGAVQFLRTVNR